MSKPVSPSQFLISLLELDTVDECTRILIVREHKNGAISYDTNTNSRMDAHCLAELCSQWTGADIVVSSIKEMERDENER